MIRQTNETFYAIETEIDSGIFLSDLSIGEDGNLEILSTTKDLDFNKIVGGNDIELLRITLYHISNDKYAKNPRIVKVSRQVIIEDVD